MASSNNKAIISEAKPHTILKFKLVEEYVKAWAQKLMNNDFCHKLVYIDCMSNSGVYHDVNGNQVKGSALRVAEVLRNVAEQYRTKKPHKRIKIYLNDLDPRKIEELKKHIPQNTGNFTIEVSNLDASQLLNRLKHPMLEAKNSHYLLFYDPYDASIDWRALTPFFQKWGEVIINHMISDPIRACGQASSDRAISKYTSTYQCSIDELKRSKNSKEFYEERVEKILKWIIRRNNKKYYAASFPFFNSRNAFLYDLIHFTGHIEGFKLFKSTAWKVFGNKSSTKNAEYSGQMQLPFDVKHEDTEPEPDVNCYFVQDIAQYVYKRYKGVKTVALDTVWAMLDEHTIFPCDGFKRDIIRSLKSIYGAKVTRTTITFL